MISNADGGCETSPDIPPPWPPLRAVVTKEGFQRLEKAIRPEEENVLQLRAQRWRIAGEITDESGEPVAEAKIAIFEDSREIAGATSDEEGRFSTKVKASGAGLKVVVTATGFRRLETTIGSQQHDRLLHLQLTKLIGMPERQAKAELDKLNLPFDVTYREISSGEEPDTVVEQNPQPQAEVDAKSPVALVVGTPDYKTLIKQAWEAAVDNRYAAALLLLNHTLQKFPQHAVEVEAEIEKVSAKLFKEKRVLNSGELNELEQPLRQAADAHSGSAQMLLGYSLKGANPNDSLRFFEMATQGGNMEASYEVGKMHAYAGNYNKAFPYYKMAADGGVVAAMYALGECYYHAKGTPRDAQEAFQYLSRAADRNDRHAQDLLGIMYLQGDWAPQDDRKAFELFSQAAGQENLNAQANLGAMYFSGIYVRRDRRKAINLWRDGAKKGNPQCMFLYAGSLEDKKPKEARGWYTRAASLGDSQAQQWCHDHNVPFSTLDPAR
jgi:TPR repeat protein